MTAHVNIVTLQAAGVKPSPFLLQGIQKLRPAVYIHVPITIQTKSSGTALLLFGLTLALAD